MAKPDVEAEVWLLPTEHSGRSRPVFSGYRGQFYYAGKDWDAVHDYPDVECLKPGDRTRSCLTFLSPGAHFGRVDVGMPFLIREGNRTVGYGCIRKLLGLEESAASDDREYDL